MGKTLSLIFTLGVILTNAQTIVSTTPENKNIILEEFTGISCGYCPDGHSIGQALHNNFPNDIFLINIHTGSYATPQGPGTDFNTIFGAAIAGQSGLTGYPAGTVNRNQFAMTQGGGTAMSRGDWGSASTQLLAQPSPANVGLLANIDMATNILTVEVEVYYTTNGFGVVAPFSNKLNIAVVQHNILGPQSGGSTYNPSAIDPATGLYTHQHMLRHMLTGQWGETISTIAIGSLYSNVYTWNIPADINGVALDPTNLSIIAFVSEGNQEIYTGTEIYPDIVFVNSYDAYCMSVSASDIICSPITNLELKFRNYGSIPLTSLDINYSINGGASTTYPWTGNLASAGTETITIPNVPCTPTANNTVTFTLANPNGQTDQNTANNSGSSTFAGLGSAISGTVSIDIFTDQYGSETTWELKENGIVITSGGPYANVSAAQPTQYATLSSNTCYSFYIYDSYGDGIFAPGGYTVTDQAGTTIASGGNFTSQEATHFETAGTPVTSWDCVNNSCIDPGTGNGTYNTIAACQAICGISEINENSEEFVSIYPNPIKNSLFINGNFDYLEIFDVFGKLILSSNFKKVIDVSKLSNGIYFVDFKSDKKNSIKKIIISK